MNVGDFASGKNDWANVIVQKWNDEYDVFDAHCFLHMWSKLHRREIVCIPYGLVPPPKGDKNKEFNNGVVSTLQPPFSGEFFGGTGDDDGYISWDVPLDAGGGLTEPIPPSILPLEVGYTAAWTTIRHCFCATGVARWPYGSNRIYLLIRVVDPVVSLNPSLRKIFGTEQ
jgi:hypothetical protein